jgi:phospholipid/cholesterol/gamma-HCH transport system permease protein
MAAIHFKAFGRRFVTFLETAGEFGLFAGRVVRDALRRPFEIREIGRQIREIGTRSVPLIVPCGIALGIVMSLHTRASLVRFGASSLIPAALTIATFRELGPMVTGLLVAGRVGAGIGSELAGMRVTEQIDALESLAIDSFKYLVITRVTACLLALPILTILMDFSGLAGGLLSEATISHISATLYIHRGFAAMRWSDYIPTTLKTAVFGFIIGAVSCFLGYRAKQGATGVGHAATQSVVLSSLLLILVNIILVKLTFFWFA